MAEDLRSGDVTTRLVVPPDQLGRAEVETRQPLVVCGLEVLRAVFETVDPSLAVETLRGDGEQVESGTTLATVEGSLHGILAAERTALNFLGRLCGVATHTRCFVDRIAGTGVRIVDTRKTLPGWRALDIPPLGADLASGHFASTRSMAVRPARWLNHSSEPAPGRRTDGCTSRPRRQRVWGRESPGCRPPAEMSR